MQLLSDTDRISSSGNVTPEPIFLKQHRLSSLQKPLLFSELNQLSSFYSRVNLDFVDPKLIQSGKSSLRGKKIQNQPYQINIRDLEEDHANNEPPNLQKF